MAESRAEQVAAAVVARLQGIVGDGGATYWFTPEKVLRGDPVQEMLDASVDTIYLLTPDRKEEARRTNSGVGCIVRGRAFYTLSLLKRHTPATDNPLFAEAPIRWTLQERMEQDVRKRLREDPKLGGISTDLDLPESEEGPQRTYLAGWALAFMSVDVTYHYTQETP